MVENAGEVHVVPEVREALVDRVARGARVRARVGRRDAVVAPPVAAPLGRAADPVAPVLE